MKKRIIVIDDEAPIRELLKKILTRAGYTVFTASDGKEAIEKLENVPVDLIMLDMNMPNMNGIEVLRTIRQKNITNKPVLMVSGSHDTQHRIESYQLGAYDFITKPEHTEVMLKRIENGLKIGEIIDFNEFMKIELFMAKKLQKYIYPEPAYISEDLEIFANTLPLSDIGGDLYDYIIFRDNRIIFFVADVSGHSISASMFTAIVKMVFRNALRVTDDPGSVMSIMNTELSANLPMESFVTMFCGLIDTKSGILKYSNAGHPKPLHISRGEYREIESDDPFLGPIRDTSYSTNEIRLGRDDLLLIYTDGLVDIIDENYLPVDLHETIMPFTSAGFKGRETFDEFITNISGDRYIKSDDCTIMVVRKK